MRLKRYGLRLIPIVLIAVLGLASLAWGLWLLAAPALQAGPYPRYGHAEDFSWIAGQMQYHIPSWSQLPDAGCSVFRYEESSAKGKLSGQVVKLGGQVWKDYYSSTDVRGDGFFVFFGHFAPANEPFMCGRDVPGYIVERVQVNPAPYPRYGHAADFSWIAGQVKKMVNLAGTCYGCECAILYYEEKGSRVQMDGEGWRTYWLNNHGAYDIADKYLVLFGHFAQPGEMARVCMLDHTAPVYIVDQVQANPLRRSHP